MKNQLLGDLAWGGGIVILALGASFARNQGYIDQDTVLRLVIGTTGLMIAYFGNRAPKLVAPSVHAQKNSRVAGWSLFLSGIVYAGLWAFAPIPLAITLGCGAVAAGMIVTMGYCYWLRAQARADVRKA